MKKLLISALAIGTIFTTVSISNAATTTTKQDGTISVSMNAAKEISPNMAEISIAIETSNKSMQIAMDENKKISTAVYNSIKGIIGKDDYVKTANFQAKPTYNYSKDKKTFDKYVVSNSVIVNTKNIELVSKIVDTAIAKGATNIDNLSFSATNYEAQCNAMLAESTKKASARANAVAGALGQSVVGIKYVSTSCSTSTPTILARNYMAKGTADMESVSTPIEAGMLNLRTTVSAEFYVK